DHLGTFEDQRPFQIGTSPLTPRLRSREAGVRRRSRLRKVAVMSVTTQHTSSTPVGGQGVAASGTNHLDLVTRRAFAVLRIAVGLTFLWAVFDKLLALGFSAGRSEDGTTVDRFGDAAGIHGGNPTLGFLKFGADGPFKSFYNAIAGGAWVNW